MKKALLASALILIFGLTADASETVKGMKKDIESFKQQTSVKMKKLDAQIFNLKKQAQAKADQTRTKAITQLESDQAKLRYEMNELKKSSKKNWKVIKGEISRTLDDLNKKIQELLK